MSCNCYRAEKNFLGKIGICIGTKECELCSCGGDEAKCDFYDYVRKRAKKPVTNGNRIRAISDEELAELISDGCCHGLCDCPDDFEGKGEEPSNCKACWLDWLKQEIKED